MGSADVIIGEEADKEGESVESEDNDSDELEEASGVGPKVSIELVLAVLLISGIELDSLEGLLRLEELKVAE